jgi:endogenous inhibitor of DNA gyrase (YacG/DUF329 family)
VIVHCPTCDKKVTVLEKSVGKRVRCPLCGEPFIVDAPTVVAPNFPPPPPKSAPNKPAPPE